MSFAERLRQVRNERKLSQEQLAEKMGVSRQTVTKWESGTGFPEVQKGLGLASLLQASLDWLFEDELKELGWNVVTEKKNKLELGEVESMSHRKINEEMVQQTLDKLYKPVIKGSFTTGIDCLDEVSGGLTRGRVYFLLGAAGIGKLPFAANIVNHFVQESRNVMFVVKNHTVQEVLRQTICIGAGVSSFTRHGEYTSEEDLRVKKIAELYSRANLVLNDSYDEPIEKLYERCLNTKEQLDLVVIDSVWLLRTVRERKNRTKESEIHFYLHSIARECRCPVLVMDRIDDKTVGDLRCHAAPENIVESCIWANKLYENECLIILHSDAFYELPDEKDDFTLSIIYYDGNKFEGAKLMTCTVNRKSHKISPTQQKISCIITPWHVIEVVCQHFYVSIDDIRSKERNEEMVIPRQIAMYLCAKYTDYSSSQIGAFFNRDHAAVLYAIEKFKDLLENDDYAAKSADTITKKLGICDIHKDEKPLENMPCG